MAARPTIGIVGAGNLGSSLALALHEAGYRVVEVVTRAARRSQPRARAIAKKIGARLLTIGEPLSSDLLWFCVPDREIANCAATITRTSSWGGRLAFHSSGALTSDELGILRRRGAHTAAVHPVMTFVKTVRPDLAGVPFALEGDAGALRVAKALVRSLGGRPFSIIARHKAAYHAWGAFASPLLIALLVTAERVARAAGISRSSARKWMLPILRQTLSNYETHGPAAAFSGPIVRGDVDTVRKHLRTLSSVSDARDVYVALARSALHDLPTPDRKKLERLLNGKRQS